MSELNNEEYLQLIKDRLNYYVDSTGRSLNSIYEACNENIKDVDLISYPTIYNIIKGSKLPNNISHVKLIADTLGIDLSLLLSPDPNIQIGGVYTSNNNQTLDSDRYMNHYYVYTYSENTKYREVIRGRLNITRDQSTSIATLEFPRVLKYANGERKVIIEKYVGTPIYNKSFNTVYMFLQSAKGDFYFLSFYYKNYNHQYMFYRKAVCVCINSQTKAPMVKNMVLLYNEPDQEFIDQYIPGLLKVEDKNFYITKEVFNELLSTPIVSKNLLPYISDVGDPIEVYQINPSKLLANFELYQNEEIIDMQYVITLLQANSLSLEKSIYTEKDIEAMVIKSRSFPVEE